jgi:hypothetical protein
VVFKKSQIQIGERTAEQRIWMKSIPRDPHLRFPARIKEKGRHHEIKIPQITRGMFPGAQEIILKFNPTL